MARFSKVLLVCLLCMSMAGCAGMQSQQQKGTAYGVGIGAGVGAIVGQAIGKDTNGTLIGAGIGALVGGLAGNQIGRYMDLQEQDLRNAVAASNAASIRREQDVLRATFKGEAYFGFDKSTLKRGAYYELRRVADVLNNYPETTIEVGGHTDVKGSASYNQQLSERRARAVKDELMRNGVAPHRIRAIGYGESRPISSSDAVNRRVEILIIPVRRG